MSRVVWCQRGFLPIFYGFCPSEAAWRRELARLGAAASPYPPTLACCTEFESPDPKAAKRSYLVTLSDSCDGDEPELVIGLIVHEAAHVWQGARDVMGERDPSPEFEAYALQYIVLNLLSAYRRTRPGLRRRKWPA